MRRGFSKNNASVRRGFSKNHASVRRGFEKNRASSVGIFFWPCVGGHGSEIDFRPCPTPDFSKKPKQIINMMNLNYPSQKTK